MAFGGELLRKVLRWNTSNTNYVTSVSGKIIAIGMERVTAFINHGPGYCVTFHSDGTVKYEGIVDVEKRGRFKAKIDTKIFSRLVDFVRDNNMLKIPDYAPALMTDNPQYIVCIRTEQGEKLIHDPNFSAYANPKVIALSEMIEELLSKIELKPDN